jgi:hypothetical protein
MTNEERIARCEQAVAELQQTAAGLAVALAQTNEDLVAAIREISRDVANIHKQAKIAADLLMAEFDIRNKPK